MRLKKTEEEIQKELKELKEIQNLKSPNTNKAYNEDEEYKKLMKNFKTISTDDFERTIKQIKDNNAERETTTNTTYKKSKDFALKQNESKSYKKLKNLLDKKQAVIAEYTKGESSLTYSLKDRRLLSYNTPRYMCERSGKIVVNIKVDSYGMVYETYING